MGNGIISITAFDRLVPHFFSALWIILFYTLTQSLRISLQPLTLTTPHEWTCFHTFTGSTFSSLTIINRHIIILKDNDFFAYSSSRILVCCTLYVERLE